MNMPLVLLNRRRRGSVGYNPAGLFSLNEPGIWLDPSDLTTMFVDRAGTTPVTTPGQSVGLRLDKSKGLVLGPELVTNGGFDTDTTGWDSTNVTSSGGTVVVTSGEAVITRGTARAEFFQTLTTVVGRSYKFVGSVTGKTGSANWWIGTTRNNANNLNLSGVSVGQQSGVFTATATTTFITMAVDGTAGQTVTIDNISVKELPGNHAVANSDAARGIYGIEPLGGRRNLLTRTEEFDNAAWIKASGATVSANAVISPDGTQNADTLICPNSSDTTPDVYVASLAVTSGVTYTFSVWLKGASNGAWPLNVYNGASHNPLVVNVTTEWQRFVVTVVASGTTMNVYLCDKRSSVSGSNTYLDSVDAYGAQLETGSTATAYQRVTTQYDVTEAGKQTLHYVQYDGSDDGYVTPTIDPSANALLGPELVTNGTFDTDTSGWTFQGTATDTSTAGFLSGTTGPTTNLLAHQVITTAIGNTYRLDITTGPASTAVYVSPTTAGGLTLGSTGFATSGDKTLTFVATSTTTYLSIMSVGFNSNASLDNISVKEVTADKVQVFAGVRKLSDAATGIVVETSADATANNGALAIRAPSLATPTYYFGSRGSIVRTATSGPNYPSPVSNILGGIGDISSDIVALRVNGAEVAADRVGDQGTGNFLAYPLYIGRRGGTTLPFNGRDYGICVRFGANLDASTISATENYMAQKTGVTL